MSGWGGLSERFWDSFRKSGFGDEGGYVLERCHACNEEGSTHPRCCVMLHTQLSYSRRVVVVLRELQQIIENCLRGR